MYLPQRVARCAGRWVGGWVFLACCEICALEHDLLYRNASRIYAGVQVSVAQLFRFLQSRKSEFMVQVEMRARIREGSRVTLLRMHERLS